MYAVELINLSFGYDRNRVILKDINLRLPFNKYICILGPNGSGKSTLSKLLIGLVQAWAGKIRVAGIEANEQNRRRVLNRLGLVFQNPDNQFIGLTIEDDIAFGLENRNVPKRVIEVIIREVSKFLGIQNLLKVNSSTLSGGEKQKVAIASTLALNPDIIVFDESTSMLDTRSKAEILGIMRTLVRKESKTVISITHDMEELLMADEVVVLREGQIFLQGKPQVLLENLDLLRQANLDFPFTHSLAYHLRSMGCNIPPFADEDALIDHLCGDEVLK